MTVHFIGAGPGAADLITVRGRDLIARCPVCLYAGSLVPPALLAHCPPGARIVDTAPMSLDEIEAEFVAAHAAGPRRGAAAFRRSLDLQRARRTDAPARAARHSLYAHARRTGFCGRGGGARTRAHRAGSGAERGAHARAGPRLAHARAGEARRLCGDRRDARDPSRHPCDRRNRRRADAVLRRGLPGRRRGARATWPDERIVRGTLADIAAKVAAEHIERTALILVGPALGGGGFPRERALRSATTAAGFAEAAS